MAYKYDATKPVPAVLWHVDAARVRRGEGPKKLHVIAIEPTSMGAFYSFRGRSGDTGRAFTYFFGNCYGTEEKANLAAAEIAQRELRVATRQYNKLRAKLLKAAHSAGFALEG